MGLLYLDALDLGPPAGRGPARWRWRLTTEHGAFLADHQVDLDPGSAEFEAFGDLDRYLRWHAAPDRQLDSEAEIPGWLGRWIGEQVLGPVGPAILSRAPAVVRVRIPDDPPHAELLAYRPLELGGWCFSRAGRFAG